MFLLFLFFAPKKRITNEVFFAPKKRGMTLPKMFSFGKTQKSFGFSLTYPYFGFAESTFTRKRKRKQTFLLHFARLSVPLHPKYN